MKLFWISCVNNIVGWNTFVCLEQKSEVQTLNSIRAKNVLAYYIYMCLDTSIGGNFLYTFLYFTCWRKNFFVPPGSLKQKPLENMSERQGRLCGAGRGTGVSSWILHEVGNLISSCSSSEKQWLMLLLFLALEKCVHQHLVSRRRKKKGGERATRKFMRLNSP